MLVEFPHELVARLDLPAAVRAEIDQPRSMLPSGVVEAALGSHVEDYARFVRSQLEAGIELDRQEAVWAPKPGPVGRYRWLTTLPIRERVILRALVADVAIDLGTPNRTAEAYEAFQSAPLVLDHKFIAAGDVASFYYFVDHQLLEQRVVDSSARADTASAITSLLACVSGRSYGLPQNFSPSDVLSEIYIAPVERKLMRSGIATYRHNDDFRLGAETWGEALQALERLGAELSAVGLELNGEKAWISSRHTYSDNVGLVERIYNEAKPARFPETDPYTGEPLEGEVLPPETEDELAELLHITAAVFSKAASNRLDGERLNSFELRANRQLLVTALYYFRHVRSRTALDRGPALVAIDPSFAHQYATYLQALALDDEGFETSDRVMDVLHRFSGHAPYWVQAWLVEPFLAPRAKASGAVIAWLRGLLNADAPSLLRSRALLGLAAQGVADVAEIARNFDSLPAIATPDVVAALGLMKPSPTDPQVRAIVGESQLARWVFDYAVEHADDARWA